MNLLVITSQKPIIDTHTCKKRERNPDVTLKTVVKSQGKSKRRNKKNYKTPETVNTVTVSTYLSTVT